MIERIIGFVFIVFGLVWSIFEKSLCSGLCEQCGTSQLQPCFFLFLFVGIIFIINGASLILTDIGKKS